MLFGFPCFFVAVHDGIVWNTILFNSFEKSLEQSFVHSVFSPDVGGPSGKINCAQSRVQGPFQGSDKIFFFHTNCSFPLLSLWLFFCFRDGRVPALPPQLPQDTPQADSLQMKSLCAYKLTRLVCNFQFFERNFREILGTLMKCFSDTFRLILRTHFRPKIFTGPSGEVGPAGPGMSQSTSWDLTSSSRVLHSSWKGGP